MPRLLLLTPTEPTRDPRARRAAAEAQRRGWEVFGIGRPAPGEVPVPLDGVTVIRIGRERLGATLRGMGLGGMRRSRGLHKELRGLYRIGRLAGRTIAIVRAGRRAGRCDVVHANDLETLPAGFALARAWHSRLVYDAHELYSSSEPDYPATYRFATAGLERALARRADAVLTISEDLADELQLRLGVRRPGVVLNCPPRRSQPLRLFDRGPLRVVYQGAMGLSRPLEDLLEAAAHAPACSFTVRVTNVDLGSLRSEIAARGLDGRVEVAEPVAPDELVEALIEFEVGLVINRPLTRNDELVLPNKLFEYLSAGLAVAAPRLPGLSSLVEGETVGITFEPARPDQLGAALDRLARDRDRLAGMRSRAYALAQRDLNAEAQADALAEAWGG